MKFWRKQPEAKQTLSDITRGMQYAVNTAQDMLEAHYVELLSGYFDKEGNPFSKRIKVREGTYMDIPLISIINQNALVIDEMEIEFKAKINAFSTKSKPNDVLSNEVMSRSCFEMDFTPGKEDNNSVLVKIKFKTNPPPEGIARIVDEFDKKITPINVVSDETT